MAPARIRSRPLSGSSSSSIPMPARMKENSPICDSVRPSASAFWIEWRNRRAMAKTAAALPARMISTVIATRKGSRTAIVGSNSIPTETKNRTANASRSGRVSWAALWLSCDSARIMPAKKAPSANEMPNSSDAPNATPSAIASTASRNSSRDPVWAM